VESANYCKVLRQRFASALVERRNELLNGLICNFLDIFGIHFLCPFGELRVGSLNQTGEPNPNGLTERTESEAVRYVRLERMATGATGRGSPGAAVC
jgi:hypothetical protein